MATAHQRKPPFCRHSSQHGRLALACRSQPDAGPSRVPHGRTPFRLTMANQPDLLRWLTHVPIARLIPRSASNA